MSTLSRTPALVIITTGRRSGTVRRTPVAYLRDGDDLVVVGGAAGQRAVPDWVANLRARPDATVVVDRRRVGVHAVELTGSARDQMWPIVRACWPRIERYQRLAQRLIPIIRLQRRTTGPDTSTDLLAGTAGTSAAPGRDVGHAPECSDDTRG